MEISSFRKKLTQRMIRPGAVFILPVQYTSKFPTTFVERMGSEPELFSEAKLKVGDVWYDESSGRYEMGSGEQELVFKAKVRPFLIVRCVSVKDVMWHEDQIFGLPICSLKPRMRNNLTFMNKLRNQEISFLYRLNPNYYKSQGLPKESFVRITTPFLISPAYFTHYCCLVRQGDLRQIRSKLTKFLNG